MPDIEDERDYVGWRGVVALASGALICSALWRIMYLIVFKGWRP